MMPPSDDLPLAGMEMDRPNFGEDDSGYSSVLYSLEPVSMFKNFFDWRQTKLERLSHGPV